MIRSRTVALLILISLSSLSLTVPTLAPDKVDMTPVDLEKTATHVVLGEVTSIYTKEETVGKWCYTRYLAEVHVADVEKGIGLAKGELIYARYWTRRYLGQVAPPSTNGHRGLAKEGETLRIYLARNAYDGFQRINDDGGFNVIGANGFEKLKGESGGR